MPLTRVSLTFNIWLVFRLYATIFLPIRKDILFYIHITILGLSACVWKLIASQVIIRAGIDSLVGLAEISWFFSFKTFTWNSRACFGMPVSLDRNPKHKAERERHLVPLFLLMQKKIIHDRFTWSKWVVSRSVYSSSCCGEPNHKITFIAAS